MSQYIAIIQNDFRPTCVCASLHEIKAISSYRLLLRDWSYSHYMSRSYHALFGASITRLAKELKSRYFNQKQVDYGRVWEIERAEPHYVEISSSETRRHKARERKNVLYILAWSLLFPILLQFRWDIPQSCNVLALHALNLQPFVRKLLTKLQLRAFHPLVRCITWSSLDIDWNPLDRNFCVP